MSANSARPLYQSATFPHGLYGTVLNTRRTYHCVVAKKVEKDSATMRDVEGMLNALCGMSPERCPNCGRRMTHKITLLSPDSDKSWTIAVGICSICDGPMGQKTAAA